MGLKYHQDAEPLNNFIAAHYRELKSFKRRNFLKDMLKMQSYPPLDDLLEKFNDSRDLLTRQAAHRKIGRLLNDFSKKHATPAERGELSIAHAQANPKPLRPHHLAARISYAKATTALSDCGQELKSCNFGNTYKKLVDTAAHLFDAGAETAQMGNLTRIAILGAANALAFGVLLMPAYASQAPVGPVAGLTNIFENIATDPRAVALNDTNLSAMTLLASQRSQSNANEEARYRSAMQGLQCGVHPLSLYLLSGIESRGGNDMQTTASSAEGMYMHLTATILQDFNTYRDQIPAYNAVKARLEANDYNDISLLEMDMELVKNVDGTLAEFRKDPDAVITRIRHNNPTSSDAAFMAYARNDIVAGQVTALFICDHAPELLIENTRNDTPEQIAQKTGNVYRTWNLGPTGGPVLNYLVANAGDTRMDSAASIAAALEDSPFKNSVSGAFMANYYAGVVKGNRPLFPNGTGISATELAAGFDGWTHMKMERDVAALDGIIARGDQLLADPEVTTAAIPNKISLAQMVDNNLTGGMVGKVTGSVANIAFTNAAAWITEVTSPKDPLADIINNADASVRVAPIPATRSNPG